MKTEMENQLNGFDIPFGNFSHPTLEESLLLASYSRSIAHEQTDDPRPHQARHRLDKEFLLRVLTEALVILEEYIQECPDSGTVPAVNDTDDVAIQRH